MITLTNLNDAMKTQEDAKLSVSEEKRDELRRRKERFLQHPSSGRMWDQVKQHARTQHD